MVRRLTIAVIACAIACSETAPPSSEDVGREVVAPPPRESTGPDPIYDARGVPLESDEVVAGLTLPRGLTKQTELSGERRHVYASEVPRARLLRYFGPRLTTVNIEERGEAVTYRDAVPRGARGGIVRLDVSVLPSSAHAARVDIVERPPPRAEGVRVSEDVIRRHLDGLTKNRE